MLIDWLTLKICASKISPEVLAMLRADANIIVCINPDGTKEWETISRVNVRSDSHQLQMSVGGFITISGSPARFIYDSFGLNDNTFGSLDIVHNANLMIGHVESSFSISLPCYSEWDLTRIDVTGNYFLNGGEHSVDSVLSHYRNAEMGKYKTVCHYDSVYWQVKNLINSGKAYAKGRQLYNNYKKRFPKITKLLRDDYCYDEQAYQHHLNIVCEDAKLNDIEKIKKTKDLADLREQVQEISKRLTLAKSILRLEVKFGSRYWNEKNKNTGAYLYRLKAWYKYTSDDLTKMFSDYFNTRIGKGVNVNKSKDIRQLCVDSAIELGLKSGSGLQAFKTFNLIKSIGKHEVYSKNNPDCFMTKTTFYNHRKILLNAGLTIADIETGKVLPFKREYIELVTVSSWGELERLAS